MDFLTPVLDYAKTVDVELALRITLQVILLVSSAFFSGSETALFSLSRLDMEKLRTTRNPYSEKIHELLDEPRRLIISILCGNELVNIASSANMAGILVSFYGEADAGWINVLVMVPVLLLVGEVTPKTFAVTFPMKFSTHLSARLLPRWITLITPLRTVVRVMSDRITTWITGEATDRENILRADEFRTLVEEGVDTGVLDATERVLIDNVLEASETEIINIMTPRTRIRYLQVEAPMSKVVAHFRKYKHPRLPVYDKHRDDIQGFVHSEDVLRQVRDKKDLDKVSLRSLLRPAHFVPPTKKVDEMFDYFQEHHTRAAIILGEYGGVSGMITMMDVLTFIFGEITGRIVGKDLWREEDENVYIVPGDMRLSDFDNLTNFGIEDPIMTTIGGAAFRLFDHLPKVEETKTCDGFRFRVVEMDGLRIKSLEVAKAGPEEANGERMREISRAVPVPALAREAAEEEADEPPPPAPPPEDEFSPTAPEPVAEPSAAPKAPAVPVIPDVPTSEDDPEAPEVPEIEGAPEHPAEDAEPEKKAAAKSKVVKSGKAKKAKAGGA